MRGLELTPSWYGASWCVISIQLSHRFIVPDLTGAQHRVYGAGETTSGGEAGDLPAETPFDLFVGLR